MPLSETPPSRDWSYVIDNSCGLEAYNAVESAIEAVVRDCFEHMKASDKQFLTGFFQTPRSVQFTALVGHVQDVFNRNITRRTYELFTAALVNRELVK